MKRSAADVQHHDSLHPSPPVKASDTARRASRGGVAAQVATKSSRSIDIRYLVNCAPSLPLTSGRWLLPLFTSTQPVGYEGEAALRHVFKHLTCLVGTSCFLICPARPAGHPRPDTGLTRSLTTLCLCRTDLPSVVVQARWRRSSSMDMFRLLRGTHQQPMTVGPTARHVQSLCHLCRKPTVRCVADMFGFDSTVATCCSRVTFKISWYQISATKLDCAERSSKIFRF